MNSPDNEEIEDLKKQQWEEELIKRKRLLSLMEWAEDASDNILKELNGIFSLLHVCKKSFKKEDCLSLEDYGPTRFLNFNLGVIFDDYITTHLMNIDIHAAELANCINERIK